MRIVNEFVIPAPYEEVWDALLDVERVAPCVPGAHVDERVDERTYRGRFRIKLGPVTASYRGTIAVEESDPSRGRVVLRGSGNDTGAGGTASAVITSQIARANGATRVTMDSDVQITGRAAQFGGRGSMLQGVADRLMRQFADRLQTELKGTGSAASGIRSHEAEPAVGGMGGPYQGAGAGGAPPAPMGTSENEARSSLARENEPLDALALARELLGANPVALAGGCAAAGFLAGLIAGVRWSR